MAYRDSECVGRTCDSFNKTDIVNGKSVNLDSLCASNVCDFNYIRYVGWQEPSPEIKGYFSQDTINKISKAVSQLTRGVDKKGRTILVPDSTICKIMDSVYQNYQPPVGDIHSRYIIPAKQNMVRSMVDQCVEIIVSGIRLQTEMQDANSKLSAWVQVMGDFNPHGLRQFPPIKTLEKRPATMQFFENY